MNSGAKGEAAAARYLKRKGYKIIETNYKTRQGEIDIIAQQGEVVVIVEVKTRAQDAIAAPREFVGAKKQQRLASAARHYIMKRAEEPFMRFDVIEVTMGRFGRPKISHIEDAFQL